MTQTAILIVLILVLAALLYIAYQLKAAVAELGRRRQAEPKESGMRSMPTAGQTINVNLAPIPGAPPVVTKGPADDSGAAPDALTGAVPQGPSPEEAETRPLPPSPGKNAAPAVPFAKICPRCKAENSVYRVECFNCGISL